jgi:hypothetical protein
VSHSLPDDAAEKIQTYLDRSDGFMSRMWVEVCTNTELPRHAPQAAESLCRGCGWRCALIREATTLRVGATVGVSHVGTEEVKSDESVTVGYVTDRLFTNEV